MAWRIPGFIQITDDGIRLLFQHLEKWLSKPRFEDGIEIGGGYTGYNAASNVKTFVDPTTIDSKIGVTTYTPIIQSTGVQPAMGNSTVNARWSQWGKLVYVEGAITLGNTFTVGTGSYKISLPVAPRYVASNNTLKGIGRYNDASAGTTYQFGCFILSATQEFNLFYWLTHNGVIGAMTAAAPVVPAVNDLYDFAFWYEAA